MQKRVNRKGFTLVELVVVIAVLAILAGVGVVAYNGYIEYTKKGQDRATVGEIMHALELADYADPGLFGPSGGAMIALTNKGVQAAGGLEGSDIEGALKDAFGDLTSTKLSYDGWNGTVDTGLIAKLGEENSKIDAYLDYLKDHTDVTASFADDMTQYWETFNEVIEGLNSGKLGGGILDLKEKKDHVVQAVVNTYTGLTDDEITEIVNMWKSGVFQDNIKGKKMDASGRDLFLARQYSIISYARKQNLSPEMRAELEAYLQENKLELANPIYHYNSATGTGSVSAFLCTCSDKKHNTEWAKVFAGYTDEMAEADAKAYLGLMEAGAAVADTMESGYTDDDILKALTPYVGMVGNVLSGRVKLENIKTLASSIGSGGNAIIVNATKSNGVLSFSVSPDDANPRTESGSKNETTEKPTECDKTSHTQSINITATSLGISVKDSSSNTIGQDGKIEICSINPAYGSCSFTAADGITVTVTSGNEYIKIEGNQIIAIKTGSAEITISNGSKTAKRTVEVH